MNLGIFSKQTPINRTIFLCMNLDIISASIKKSISAWLLAEYSGKVLTATGSSSLISPGMLCRNPW